MATLTVLAQLVAAILVVYYGVALLLFKLRGQGPGGRKLKAPLPPGPKGLPLIGNVRDLPPPGTREWEHWTKHRALYGPISSLTAFGTTIIILNDARAALELLEKRGSAHSSRPRMVFLMDLAGWGDFAASLPYGSKLRAYRQRLHRFVGTRSLFSGDGRYASNLEIEARRFLLRAIEAPTDLLQHARTEAGAIILKMAYGYTIRIGDQNEGGGGAPEPDPLVTAADQALAQFSVAAVPGAWMVDMLPVLRYVPSWVPGAGFHKTARLFRDNVMEMAQKPMDFVKQQMEAGKYEPSYVSEDIQRAGGLDEMSEEDQNVTKWSAASLYTGGADTSVSTMQTFFLAMLVYPDFQRKAQEEIDRVVGTQRLPTLEDRSRLPYVDAIVKEAFRWHPVAPMGLPHVPTQDDIYEGYLIPKDAIIMPNIWYFTHDPEVYKDPMVFNPERYLVESPPPDPRDYVFGFGRRRCPGWLLADSSVWLTIAKSLAALEFRKLVVDGKEVEPKVLFEPGGISHPCPFEATVGARSSQHEQLIRTVEIEYPWEKGSAESVRGIWT